MGQNKYKRKPPSRIQKDSIYIVCGGTTEKLYFDMFKKIFQTQLYGKKIKTRLSPCDPLNIIKECITIKERNEDCLKIWAVFDKDDFDNFDNAIELAQKNNILCAFSNQAFEIWLINHYDRINSSLPRTVYAEKLKKLCGNEYRKNNKSLKYTINILLELSKVEKAIEYAEDRFQNVQNEKNMRKYSEFESCTTVYKLVKELLKKHP